MVGLRIVIVNYNVRHFVLQCLESIYRSDLTNIDLDITVVDNASIDGSVGAIREKYPSVETIASKVNLGFGKANNLAIHSTNKEYCLLLNPDTIIQEDTLQKCISYMQNHVETAALGVKMVDGNGIYLRESKRSLPSPISSFYKISRLSDIFSTSTYFNSYYTKDLSGDLDENVEVLCGAFMFCKTKVLQELGGFDEAFFMYGEDIDLSKRIIETGKNIHYLGSTRIIHFKGESSKKASFNYIHSFYNAMIIYVDKHYQGQSAYLTKVLLKLAIILTGLLRSFKEFLSNIIHPIIDFIVIYISINVVKDLWSEFYFGINNYYDVNHFKVNSLFYSLMWVGNLWFWGWYDGQRKFKSLLLAITFGTILILTSYGLFPMQYRSSRVLILFGAVLAFILPVFINIVKNKVLKLGSNNKITYFKTIIIGNKVNAKIISQTLENQNHKFELIGIVNPNVTETDPDYINNIDYLNQIVDLYKVDEIIFTHNDISTEKMMDLMTISSSNIKYRIADVNNLQIIGSENSKTQGSFYDTYSNYNLSKSVYRRLKRLFDITIAIGLILGLPFLIFIRKYRVLFFKDIGNLIIGKKTLIGYDLQNSDANKLPRVKKGIIQITESIAPKEYTRLIEKNINNWYSKYYTPFIDLEIFKNHLL